MGINAKIWSELESLVGRSKFSEAIALLEAEVMNCDTTDELSVVARKLAHLYRHGAGPSEEEKANNYALLAGQSYVKAGRMAPAVAMMKWLQESKSAEKHIAQLQTWISTAFSSPSPLQASSDEHLPIPTPYRELTAFVSFENEDVELSRNQWNRILPKKTPLFSDLRANEVDQLIRLARVRELGPGSVLFREGDKPAAFYVVVDGEMELSSSVGVRKVFREGEFFGEVALLAQMPRTATLKTLEGATVLEFHEQHLKAVFREFPSIESRIFQFYELRLFLNVASRSVFFGSFQPSEVEEIYDFFTPIHVPANRVLLEQGMPSDRLYFVVKGFCEVLRDGKSLAQLGPGQFIGEIGLIQREKRTATVKAMTDCHLLECHELVFKELVQQFPKLKTELDELARVRSPQSDLDITDKIVVD